MSENAKQARSLLISLIEHSWLKSTYCDVACVQRTLRAQGMVCVYSEVPWSLEQFTENCLVQDSEFKSHIVIKGRTVKIHMLYYVCIFIKNFGRIQQNPIKLFTSREG